MKRIFALILALCMTFSLFACGKKQADPTPGSQSSANTGTADPGQGGGSAAPTDPGIGGSGSGSGSGDPSGTSSTGSGWAGTRVAVIYFSCTGNTRTAAERIRDLTGADLIELVPEQPYTSQDLDYNDESCRANQEQKDPAARPRIAGQPLDLSQYGTIYLGYPIWQGTAPRIINTFLDSYDLTGKTIRPFCTSGRDLRGGYPGGCARGGRNGGSAHRRPRRQRCEGLGAGLINKRSPARAGLL